MIHVLSAFAEHERDLIAARTRAALAAAKSRGARLGNPDIATARAQARLSIQSAADDFSANVGPLILQIQRSGVHSLQGIADALAPRSEERLEGKECVSPC